MKDNGVEFYFNDAIERIEGNEIDYEKWREFRSRFYRRVVLVSFRIRH